MKIIPLFLATALSLGVSATYAQGKFKLTTNLDSQERLSDEQNDHDGFAATQGYQDQDDDRPLGKGVEPSVKSAGSRNIKSSQGNSIETDTQAGEASDDAMMSINIFGVGSALDEITPSMMQLYADKVNAYIRTLTANEISKISPNDFGKIPPSGVAFLTLNQIRGITSAQIKALTRDQITQLNSGQIKELFGRLSEADFDIIFSQITKKQVRDFIVRLSPAELKGLSMNQLGKTDVEVFSRLSSQQFAAFSPDQIATFTTSQVNNFTDNQLYWSYLRLTPGLQRANFIRILNRERLIAIIKFLPKTSYAQVFNDANPRVLSSLINAVSDSEKLYLLEQLNGVMISEIFDDLPDSLVPKLKPNQIAFLSKEQANKVVQLTAN